MYSMNQLLKILQTSCFATFGSSACPEGLPDMYVLDINVFSGLNVLEKNSQ